DVRIGLRERMQQASRQLDFERAAQVRDALKWLDQLEQPQAVELVGGGDADAVGLARDGDDVCGVVLRVRDGKVIARDHRFLENAEHETEATILAAFLVRCYLPLEVRARKVLLPFPPAPEDLASLGELAPEVEWHVPQRGSKAQLAELADQNARHLLDSLKIESFDIDERAARAAGRAELPIVSLAKREEEIFLPGRADPLALSRRSPSLKLLQRARDEAHRFAVSYSRQRRARRTITSELLAIPGIGPGRRR